MRINFNTVFLFLSLIVMSSSIVAQQKEVNLNSKTVYKDSHGNLITFKRFIELTEYPDYIIDPIFNEHGQMIEIYVVYPQNTKGMTEIVKTPEPELVPSLLNYGEVENFKRYKGKVLVLNFWFARCRPCIKEIPILNELVQEFEGQAVSFVAPTFEENETVTKFLKKNPFKYDMLPNARPIINQLNVFGFPTHMVFDQEGKLAGTFTGSHEIKNKIKDLIITLAPNSTK